MANIFKKIKTIDTIGDAPKPAKAEKPASHDDVRLGLKPVLKTPAGDMSDATEFQDPFGFEDNSDFTIPEYEDIISDDAPVAKDKNAAPSSHDIADKTVNADSETLPPAIIEKADEIETAYSPTADKENLNKATVNEDSAGLEQEAASLSSVKDTVETTDPKAPRSPLTLSIPPVSDKKLNLHPLHDIAKPQADDRVARVVSPRAQNEPIQNKHREASEDLPQFLSAPQGRDRDLSPLQYETPKWPFWTLAVMAFLWLLCSAAAAYGYFELGLNELTAEPIHAFGFIGFVVVPACLLGLTAVLLRYLGRLSRESQKLAYLNQQLISPADQAGQSATRFADNITHQMDRIEQRADQAFNRLMVVETAFSAQIEAMSNTLKTSVQEQTALDSQLRTSKTAWSGAIKDTDQSLSELSGTLERVFDSFQTRVDTTQQKMSHLSSALETQVSEIGDGLSTQSQAVEERLQPLMDKAERLQKQLAQHHDAIASLKTQTQQSVEDLDGTLDSQAQKLSEINAQQDIIKSGKAALSTLWDDEDTAAQDRLFRHISQIDRLNDRTDNLIKKIDQASEQLMKAAQQKKQPHQQPLTLRGTLQEEQLSLLPGLGAAKDMLPSLLTPENENDAALYTYNDIEDPERGEAYHAPASDIPSTLSSQRVFDAPEPDKQNWFKRFGRRATDPVIPQNHIAPVSALPAAPPPQHNHMTQAPFGLEIDRTSLRDKLIAMQLSPDALIDSGTIQEAARLRFIDGPFAMSRYISTHLGAAIDYLRSQLPDDPVLRRQVYDMTATFPLREQLDEKDEVKLVHIFETNSGREYLLCEAALNG